VSISFELGLIDLYSTFFGKIVPPDFPFVEIYMSGLGSSSS